MVYRGYVPSFQPFAFLFNHGSAVRYVARVPEDFQTSKELLQES
jgi:hypothetical protein